MIRNHSSSLLFSAIGQVPVHIVQLQKAEAREVLIEEVGLDQRIIDQCILQVAHAVQLMPVVVNDRGHLVVLCSSSLLDEGLPGHRSVLSVKILQVQRDCPIVHDPYSPLRDLRISATNCQVYVLVDVV